MKEVSRDEPSVELACSRQVMDGEGEVEGGWGVDAACTQTEGNSYGLDRRMCLSAKWQIHIPTFA